MICSRQDWSKPHASVPLLLQSTLLSSRFSLVKIRSPSTVLILSYLEWPRREISLHRRRWSDALKLCFQVRKWFPAERQRQTHQKSRENRSIFFLFFFFFAVLLQQQRSAQQKLLICCRAEEVARRSPRTGCGWWSWAVMKCGTVAALSRITITLSTMIHHLCDTKGRERENRSISISFFSPRVTLSTTLLSARKGYGADLCIMRDRRIVINIIITFM